LTAGLSKLELEGIFTVDLLPSRIIDIFQRSDNAENLHQGFYWMWLVGGFIVDTLQWF